MESEGNTRQHETCSTEKDCVNPIHKHLKLNKLKIATYNCRSINNKTVEVVEYLDDLDCDMCLLQESWLKQNDDSKLAEIEELGYKILSAPRNNRSGGGLAVLYKAFLNVKLQKTVKKYKSFETMEVVLKGESDFLRFVNLYRPPYSRKHKFTVADFLVEFEEYVESFVTKQGDTIFAGDFNMHVEDQLDSNISYLNDMFSSYFIKNIVPLSPTQSSGGTLDLIIVPEDFDSLLSNVEIQEFGSVSDHLAVTCQIDFSMDLKPKEKISLSYRKFNDIDIELFRSDIRCSKLNDISSFGSIDEACECYNNVLTKLINKHCPLIEKEVKAKHKPWFDEELRNNRRNRRKLERLCRKNPTETNKRNYNQYCKTMARLIKRKRRDHYHGLIRKVRGNTKNFYAAVNPLLGRKKKCLPTSIDDKKLADNFQRFFQTEGCKYP